jgi:filamentous hemagglutinin
MPVACTHNVNAADSARGSNVSIKAIGDGANSYITIKGSDIKPAGTTTQDTLIESFAGSHDFIDGKLSGLYDEQENIKRWMSDTERAAYDIGVTIGAIPLAAPFAAAERISPEVWKAIGILLGAGR